MEWIINWGGLEVFILKLGSIAGALAGVAALLWKLLKPVYERKKKEKAELAAYRAGVAKSIEQILSQLKDYEEDIAFIQRYDLKMAHASLMTQGWCSAETKAAVLDLYDHYSGERKRNSLVASYRRDIESLPPEPDKVMDCG